MVFCIVYQARYPHDWMETKEPMVATMPGEQIR